MVKALPEFRPIAVILYRLFLLLLFLWHSFHPTLLVAAQPGEGEKPVREQTHPAQYSIGTVIEAFQKRQDSIQSARFVWTRRHVTPKEAIALVTDQNESQLEDVALNSDHDTLLIKKQKIRYQTQIADLSPGSKVKEGSLVTAFDGELNYSYQPAQYDDSGRGVIGAASVSSDLPNAHILALFLATMPLHSDLLPIDASTWEVGESRRVIDGASCIEVRPQSQLREKLHRKIWVDPDRDFIPLRFEEFRGDGSTVAMVEMKYQREKENWIPSKWKVDCYFSRNQFTEGSENTLIECALNEPISDDEFRIKYPAGTIVFDKRRVGNQEFVVQGDGTMVARGSDLLQKEISSASSETKWRRYLKWINVLVVVVIVFWAILRRQQRARAQKT